MYRILLLIGLPLFLGCSITAMDQESLDKESVGFREIEKQKRKELKEFTFSRYYKLYQFDPYIREKIREYQKPKDMALLKKAQQRHPFCVTHVEICKDINGTIKAKDHDGNIKANLNEPSPITEYKDKDGQTKIRFVFPILLNPILKFVFSHQIISTQPISQLSIFYGNNNIMNPAVLIDLKNSCATLSQDGNRIITFSPTNAATQIEYDLTPLYEDIIAWDEILDKAPTYEVAMLTALIKENAKMSTAKHVLDKIFQQAKTKHTQQEMTDSSMPSAKKQKVEDK